MSFVEVIGDWNLSHFGEGNDSVIFQRRERVFEK